MTLQNPLFFPQGEPPFLLAMGVPVAVRRAVSAYRRQQNGGNDSWFDLEVPMTSDKIRMACQDATTRAVEARGAEVKEAEKIGIQL